MGKIGCKPGAFQHILHCTIIFKFITSTLNRWKRSSLSSWGIPTFIQMGTVSLNTYICNVLCCFAGLHWTMMDRCLGKLLSTVYYVNFPNPTYLLTHDYNIRSKTEMSTGQKNVPIQTSLVSYFGDNICYLDFLNNLC